MRRSSSTRGTPPGGGTPTTGWSSCERWPVYSSRAGGAAGPPAGAVRRRCRRRGAGRQHVVFLGRRVRRPGGRRVHREATLPSPRPRVVYGMTLSSSASAFLRGQLAWFSRRGWDVHLVASRDYALETIVEREGVTAHL